MVEFCHKAGHISHSRQSTEGFRRRTRTGRQLASIDYLRVILITFLGRRRLPGKTFAPDLIMYLCTETNDSSRGQLACLFVWNAGHPSEREGKQRLFALPWTGLDLLAVLAAPRAAVGGTAAEHTRKVP